MSSALPQGWEEKELLELVLIKGGKRLPKGSPLQTTKNSHPYLRVRDMSNRIINFDNLEFVPDNTFEKIKRYIVNTNDLILSIVGTVGLLSLVDEKLDNASLTENCVKLSGLEKNDSLFLYYYLTSYLGQNEIKKGIVGAVQPKLPIYNIEKIKVLFPPKNERKRIADILSAFDDKIELNNQMNQTLEDMATALFKEWFENFNFPNSEGKAYKANGGEMKPSELGEIPIDWEVQSLKDISKIISKGTTPRKIDVDGLDSTVLFLKVKDINNDGTINFDSLEKIPTIVHQKQLKRSILKLDDILVSIAGTIGRTSITPKELDNANCNQAIAFIRLKDKEKYKKYVYQWIKTSLVQSQINSGIVQGVQANVSLTTLGNLNITIPDKILIEKFNNMFSPIFEQIQQNQQQNQILKKQRDTLLPKLMSGEIRV